MLATTPPTSQKERPISFVLDDQANGISPDWVPLVIRPEDLTRSEPSRVTVHQTLEPGPVGWVDSFGQGLPTISIQGHTGWRATAGTNKDGADQFEYLHEIVVDKYQRQRQRAIDFGLDPSGVRLLFVDELDNFSWEVVPLSFVLRRSKSRPLLMQYNIQMQAVSLDVETPIREVSVDHLFAGLDSLDSVIGQISGAINGIASTINGFVAPIAAAVRGFMHLTTGVFSAVRSVLGAVTGGVRSVANNLLGIARDLANAGRNVFNTISAITTLPGYVKHAFQQVADAYQTAFCLFRNSLRARGKTYQNYSGLYGSSNCSSTTGGTPPSAFANTNVFEDLRPMQPPLVMTPAALGSVATLSRTDPVLAPMPVSEVGRNLSNVVTGFNGFSGDFVSMVKSVGSNLLDSANASFAKVKA